MGDRMPEDDLLVRDALLVTPDGLREGDCLIRAGRIAALGRFALPPGVPVVDAGGRYLAPAFLDLHVHGGGGADFMEGDPDGARAVVAFHRRHGTARLLATVVPGPIARMRRAMAAARGVPGVLGIHLEGPFLNPERCGALDPAWFLPPSADAFRELVAGFEGEVKFVTLAPELPGALDLVAEVRRIGAVPALGHSAATHGEAEEGFRQGVGHVAHLGNAMTGLGHRDPGAVGAALLSGASVELVLDGVHVHPAFARLVVEFLRGRGELRRLCLVSDATAPSGMPEGTYRLGGREIRLRGGEVRLPDGTLAGSCLTLDRAVGNALRFAGLSLPEAVALASANPARALGLRGVGALAVGAEAPLLLLGPDLEVEALLSGADSPSNVSPADRPGPPGKTGR